jgi:hypothetical protein
MQGLPEDIVEDIVTQINRYLHVLPSPLGTE